VSKVLLQIVDENLASAYVSVGQRTSAYVSVRQRTSGPEA
jgi:hypothetical protein